MDILPTVRLVETSADSQEAPTVRFIHTADLQLGMTRRFLDDETLRVRVPKGVVENDGDTAIGHDDRRAKRWGLFLT